MKRKADQDEDGSKCQKTDAASPRTTRKTTARKSVSGPSPVIVSVSSTRTATQPVIMNVVSGQQAVSAVTGEPTPEPPHKEPEKKVTVSSGLYWNWVLWLCYPQSGIPEDPS